MTTLAAHRVPREGPSVNDIGRPRAHRSRIKIRVFELAPAPSSQHELCLIYADYDRRVDIPAGSPTDWPDCRCARCLEVTP